MTTFFTADTHFGDHRTINLWRRQFDIGVDARDFAPVTLERLLDGTRPHGAATPPHSA